jgi:hypothetical protein
VKEPEKQLRLRAKKINKARMREPVGSLFCPIGAIYSTEKKGREERVPLAVSEGCLENILLLELGP